MYLIYSALLGMAMVVGFPYWLYQMLRYGKYRKGLRERLGVIPARVAPSAQPAIWVHAVSVGEVLAVSELVLSLRQQYPDRRIAVSSTTDTGFKLATQRFGPDNVFYFPIDFAFAVRRWMAFLRPELVIVAETEFWPNFLWTAHRQGAHVAIVNARISDRSLPGYRRWKRYLRSILQNVDLFLAQTAEDASRLIEIGAPEGRVAVGGNLKFDVPPPTSPPIVQQVRNALAQYAAGPVLVCGSTVDEEEESLLLGTFKKVLATYPSTVMLLAPRHPQRFERAAELLERLGIRFWRRSRWAGENLRGSVLLIDTIGELAGLYALADVAFVGGSLVPRGGHNIIEPAQHGVATLIGNHYENFREIINFFQWRDAVRVVGPAELPLQIMELLGNDNERQALGRRAAETLESQRGATQLTLDKLKALLAKDTIEVVQA
jgi:3-deoxy-D-manno-octulosonic-acid transferase